MILRRAEPFCQVVVPDHKGSTPKTSLACCEAEALTNQERVGMAVELLRDGLKPFVERELQAVHG